MPTYQEFTGSKVITAGLIHYMDGLFTIHAERGFFRYCLKKPGMDITVSSRELAALEEQAFLDINHLLDIKTQQ